MTRHSSSAVVLACTVLVLCSVQPRLFSETASVSSDPAHTLVMLMMSGSMEAFAAADPQQPGRFVAALLVPGGQLLVVSTPHPSTAALEQRIAMHAYRDVYLDLQGTPTPKGKFFVQDTGADGIHDGRDGVVDIVYEDGARQTVFDRALAKTLSGAAYQRALQSADERYAHMLSVLGNALRASSTAGPAGTGQGE